jgi:hypothetical protein
VLGTYLLAGVISATIAGLEFQRKEYGLWFILWPPWKKCRAFWWYVLFYGGIGALAVILFDFLTAQGFLEVHGLGINTWWGKAIYIGGTARAILSINVYQQTDASGKPTGRPFGLKIVVDDAEKYFIKEARRQGWREIRKYVRPRADRFPDLDDVRQKVLDELPPIMDDDELKSFVDDINSENRVLPLMERYLKTVGKDIFDDAFPTQP